MTTAIIVTPFTIPQFRSTEEAVAWGAEIPFFAVPLVQATMRQLDEQIRCAQARRDLQLQIDLATRRQLLREAIETRHPKVDPHFGVMP
jgi:hypothetical protein